MGEMGMFYCLIFQNTLTNKLAAQAPGFIHGACGFFCFLKESLKDDKRVKIID